MNLPKKFHHRIPKKEVLVSGFSILALCMVLVCQKQQKEPLKQKLRKVVSLQKKITADEEKENLVALQHGYESENRGATLDLLESEQKIQ